jgi:hypothetical protein
MSNASQSRYVQLRSVYFIEAVGCNAVKIGTADNPTARLAALQTGCPEKLVLRAYMTMPASEADSFEKKSHHLLSDYRIRGEWFRLDAPPIDYVLKTLIPQNVSDPLREIHLKYKWECEALGYDVEANRKALCR